MYNSFYSCTVGTGFLDLAGEKEVQQLIFSKDKTASKTIYQPGALRKV